MLIFLNVDEVPTKATPYREQAVKDAKGRYQRFHGAFTGGFSAGYFNSVGTKEGLSMIYEPPIKKQNKDNMNVIHYILAYEISFLQMQEVSPQTCRSILSVLGWTPSTFVSSRNQKGERQTFNPEDFMDEEVGGYQFIQCAIDGIN